MTPLVRTLTAGWALLSLVVLAFVDVTALRWLLVVPVLVFGPGLVVARFVSPDNGRYRATITAVAGLAALVLVSEAFAIGHAFDVESIAAVLAAVTVIGAMAVPNSTSVVAILPPRPPIDPRSAAARRFRVGAPARRLEFDGLPEETAAPEPVSSVAYAVSSPTLGALVEVRR